MKRALLVAILLIFHCKREQPYPINGKTGRAPKNNHRRLAIVVGLGRVNPELLGKEGCHDVDPSAKAV